MKCSFFAYRLDFCARVHILEVGKMLVKIIAISSQKTTPSERLLRGGLCLLALAIAVKPLAQAVGYHLCYATATTAASGGNREELLEPRPAGCECRPRHEADAGSRNPS